jgi:hypothetical protein
MDRIWSPSGRPGFPFTSTVASPGYSESTMLVIGNTTTGPDGSPVVYRYEPPPRPPDGIHTGVAGPRTLRAELAERLVSGVIDGTYPEVRSILVYHKGALVTRRR